VRCVADALEAVLECAQVNKKLGCVLEVDRAFNSSQGVNGHSSVFEVGADCLRDARSDWGGHCSCPRL
jgi:hypothetical protein